MKSIAFFNNKGGVGKTTLACNYASFLASDLKSRVIVVDCDPQANASQLLLADEVWEEVYEDREASEGRTLLKALSQIRAGDSTIDSEVEIIPSSRFGVGVLSGHPSLSTVEDQLSSSWIEFRGGVLGGARRSLWVKELLKSINAEYVVFDLGPSLGALNRSVLLGCDFFVTPVAADLFSLYALENIGEWLSTWTFEYRSAQRLVIEKNPRADERYDIPSTPNISSGYAGYTVQQYVAKVSSGKIRKTIAYDRYRLQIPERAKALDNFSAPEAHDPNLGVVPSMFSMVPLAQAAHSPILSLEPSDGVRGAQVFQRDRYKQQLQEIFGRLSMNVGAKN